MHHTTIKPTLDDYLVPFGFCTNDFFDPLNPSTPQAIESILQFAKENILTKDELLNIGSGTNILKAYQSKNSAASLFLILVKLATIKLKYSTAEKLLTLVGSFERSMLLINLFGQMDDGFVWEKLFAKWWSNCDGCTLHSNEFIEVFNKANLNEIRKAGSKQDVEFYNNLPDMVTVFRGTIDCDEINPGISWTLDIDVARKFARIADDLTYMRGAAIRYVLGLGVGYAEILKKNPAGGIIIKATVPKEKIIYANTRGESEVIITFNMSNDEFTLFETI